LSNVNKSVSQSTINMESKINTKPQMNQRPFVKQALRSKIQRLYPCDKDQKQKVAKLQRKTFNP
jgi:hypothetical protein